MSQTQNTIQAPAPARPRDIPVAASTAYGVRGVLLGGTKMSTINEPKTTMRRQGSGWIVSSWDAGVACWRESAEMNYWAARAAVGTDNCRNPDNCTIRSHRHN